MDTSHFALVVYDISNDRRRTRLHNLLLDFGTPVQYSVFELLVDGPGLIRLQTRIRQVIRPRLDRVRIYYVCERCLARTQVLCGREVLTRKGATCVV